MSLYIDENALDGTELIKAVQVPNVGMDAPSSKQAKVEHISSYDRQNVGVSTGSTPDSPDVGSNKWGAGTKVGDVLDQHLEEKKDDEEDGEESQAVAKALSDLSSIVNKIVSSYEPLLEEEKEFLVKKGIPHARRIPQNLENEFHKSLLSDTYRAVNNLMRVVR